MTSPVVQTISVRFTADEHRLLDDLAKMRGVTTSDVVRELMGFQREAKRPALRVVSG